MIELGSEPLRGCMAHRAVCWEACGLVIRVFRIVEIRHVTSAAVDRYAYVLAVGVAQIAGHIDVRSGQAELRLIVVKFGRRPLDGSVAEDAVLSEARGPVVHDGFGVEIFCMARVAILGCSGELVIDMAQAASDRHVGAG